MLNSFWGKFGQRNNMTNLVYFKDPAKYFQLITNPAIIVHSVVMVTDTMLAVAYTNEDEFVEVMGNTNVVPAAFTTAQARLRLYEYIGKLGERVLYFDTDSVIYVSHTDREEYNVPIGSYLGDMTDELKDWARQLHQGICERWPKELWLPDHVWHRRQGTLCGQSERLHFELHHRLSCQLQKSATNGQGFCSRNGRKIDQSGPASNWPPCRPLDRDKNHGQELSRCI